MASTVKNPTLRMVLPVALGMAFGIGLGAVSLANGLFPNVISPRLVAEIAPQQILVPTLGAGSGIRFERTIQNDISCWNTARSGVSEGLICRE